MSPNVYLFAIVLLVASGARCWGDAQGIKVSDLQSYMTNHKNAVAGPASQRAPYDPEQGPLEEEGKEGTLPSADHALQPTLPKHDEYKETAGPIEPVHPNPSPHSLTSHNVNTDAAPTLEVYNRSFAINAKGSRSASQVEREEEKLRNATVKLVMWLRNRLRKRLEEVANLERDMDTEKIVLQNLQLNITNTTAAREDEIRLKLRNQKRLTAFRRRVEEPEKQLMLIQSQTKKLSDKLAHLGEVYNNLAEKHRAIFEKLHAAGLSHWLETRGKEYMPATAVGVLSKSIELFEPVSEGIERVVELDDKIAREVEAVVPLERTNLIVEALEDLVMLMPMIPVFLLMYRLMLRIHRLSVLHVVMYFATAFCTEAVLLLFASLCLGREPLRTMQQSHESLLVAGILINVLLYAAYLMTQFLIAVLKTSRFEILQTVLGIAVGYHCFQTVFRPAVLNEPVAATEMSYMMYILNFCLVIYEKKTVLKIDIPYEEEVNDFLISIESWFWETVEAMSNVFREKRAEMDTYSESTASELCFSEYTAVTESDAKRGVEQMGKEETGGTNNWARAEEAVSPLRGARAPDAVLPLRGRRSYDQWSRARLMTRAQVYHSNRVDIMGQPCTLQGSEVAVSQLARDADQVTLDCSKSEGSSVYGSCRE